MGKIHFVTDSTAYFEKVTAKEKGVDIVPLKVEFLGETKSEGFPGEFEEFFSKLKTAEEFPKTSQPSVGEFAKVFTEIVEKGDEVIVLTISSKLSGTYNSASAAAQMVDSEKISVIDSESTAANLKLLVETGMELANEGKSRLEIVYILNDMKKRMGISLTVDTLEYLKKGGRLTSTQALIGSILNVKPVLALIDGKLEPVAKVRGKKKALEAMAERIHEDSTHITILHIFSMEEAEEVKTAIQVKHPNAKINIEALGPVIGAHLGPKAMGICYKW
jgi:DegV family protein with EDD domain